MATIYGTTGSDSIDGTSDRDTIYSWARGGNASSPSGNDTLIGEAGDDTLYGGTDDDSLYGDAGNDYLSGGNGNDTLDGGDGNNKLYGDAGNDYLSGNYEFTGSSGNSTLYGGTGNDYLVGGDGNNKLYGGDGNDTLVGSSYGIFDTNFNYRQYGGNGNDELSGGNGNDYLDGGSGNDTLTGGLGSNTLTGGAGADAFNFYSLDTTSDKITDFVVKDDTITVSANFFGSGLTAGAAITPNQFVIGSAAADKSDRFIYNQNTGALFFDPDGTGTSKQVQLASLPTKLAMTNADIFVIDYNDINGTDGNDTIYGGVGNDDIGGSDGDDILYGGDGDDTLSGNGGNNVLYGDDGDDYLQLGSYIIGGDGNDTLYGGGTGSDTLTGGAGKDQFSLDNSADGDVITDFSVNDDTIFASYDALGIDKITFGSDSEAITPEQFILGSAAANANNRFIYNQNTGALFFDRDGTGAAEQVQLATLSTGLALTNANIIVDTFL